MAVNSRVVDHDTMIRYRGRTAGLFLIGALVGGYAMLWLPVPGTSTRTCAS